MQAVPLPRGNTELLVYHHTDQEYIFAEIFRSITVGADGVSEGWSILLPDGHWAQRALMLNCLNRAQRHEIRQ